MNREDSQGKGPGLSSNFKNFQMKPRTFSRIFAGIHGDYWDKHKDKTGRLSSMQPWALGSVFGLKSEMVERQETRDAIGASECTLTLSARQVTSELLSRLLIGQPPRIPASDWLLTGLCAWVFCSAYPGTGTSSSLHLVSLNPSPGADQANKWPRQVSVRSGILSSWQPSVHSLWSQDCRHWLIGCTWEHYVQWPAQPVTWVPLFLCRNLLHQSLGQSWFRPGACLHDNILSRVARRLWLAVNPFRVCKGIRSVCKT